MVDLLPCGDALFGQNLECATSLLFVVPSLMDFPKVTNPYKLLNFKVSHLGPWSQLRRSLVHKLRVIQLRPSYFISNFVSAKQIPIGLLILFILHLLVLVKLLDQHSRLFVLLVKSKQLILLQFYNGVSLLLSMQVSVHLKVVEEGPLLWRRSVRIVMIVT